MDLDATPPPSKKLNVVPTFAVPLHSQQPSTSGMVRRPLVNQPINITRKLLHGKRRNKSPPPPPSDLPHVPLSELPTDVAVLRARVQDLTRCIIRNEAQHQHDFPDVDAQVVRLRAELSVATNKVSSLEETIQTLKQELRNKNEEVSKLQTQSTQYYTDATVFKCEKESIVCDFSKLNGIKHSIIHIPIRKESTYIYNTPKVQPAMLNATFTGCVGDDDHIVCKHLMVEHKGEIVCAKFDI